MGLSNLPPGVTESQIPGNTKEDEEWDHALDWVTGATQISPRALCRLVSWWCQVSDIPMDAPHPFQDEEGST